MASDLKDGLWTFWEDIRQVTVGDEGISAHSSRSMRRNAPLAQSGGKRSDGSFTPNQNDERLGRGPRRAGSTSSISKEKLPRTRTADQEARSAEVDSSFLKEFDLDTAGETFRDVVSEKDPSTWNKRPGDADPLDVNRNWGQWQPNRLHSPSSSHSTIASKRMQSPVTQLSSPRTSARYVQKPFVPGISKLCMGSNIML
jgi:hypothetical protein